MPNRSFWCTAHEQVEDQLPLLLVAMAQAVSAVPPQTIDLTIPQPCEAQGSTNDEIVVCGRRGDDGGPYRIDQTPPRPSDSPKAEMQIAEGIKVAGETENVAVGGFPSNRLMLRLKIKF